MTRLDKKNLQAIMRRFTQQIYCNSEHSGRANNARAPSAKAAPKAHKTSISAKPYPRANKVAWRRPDTNYVTSSLARPLIRPNVRPLAIGDRSISAFLAFSRYNFHVLAKSQRFLKRSENYQTIGKGSEPVQSDPKIAHS